MLGEVEFDSDKLLKQINEIRKKVDKQDLGIVIEAQIEGVEESNKKILSLKTSFDDVNEVIESVVKTSQQLGVIQTVTAKGEESVRTLAVNFQEIESAVSKYSKELQLLKTTKADVISKNTELTSQFDVLEDKLSNPQKIESLNTLKQEVTELKNNLAVTNKKLVETQQLAAKVGKSANIKNLTPVNNMFDIAEIEEAIRSIEGLSEASIRMEGTVNHKGQSFQRVMAYVKDADGIFRQTAISINKATGEVFKLDKGLRTKGDTLTSIIGKVAQWAIGTSLVYLPIRQLQLSIRTLREMDTHLTDLSRVTDVTRTSFQQLGVEALRTASYFGRAVTDVLSAQVAFARAGFDNYQQMAELSLIIQTAGQMNEAVATAYIIASNAAFGFGGDMERLTGLLDAQNEVSNRHAVTLQFLADATRVVYIYRPFNVNPIAQGCAA